MSSVDDFRNAYLNNPDLLRIFQSQVQLQCGAVTKAAHHLEQYLNAGRRLEAWVEIQNLLTAAANLSKVLWGQGGKRAAQRKPLRDSLEVKDTSPLQDVAMRNHFEHFDERLDRWWQTTQNFNYIDTQIGLHPRYGNLAWAPQDIFREFDPITSDVVFWGERFNLRRIADEAESLLARVNAELAKPHPHRGPSSNS